jgi:hypothetical protein
VADRAYDSESFQVRPRRRHLSPSPPPQERRVRRRPEQGCPAKTDPGHGERRKVVRTFVRPGGFHRSLVCQWRYTRNLRAVFLVTLVALPERF